MNVIDLMVVDSIKEAVAEEILNAELSRLECECLGKKAELSYAKGILDSLKRMGDMPAVYADSIFAGVDIVRKLEKAHGDVRSLERSVKKLEADIFKHKIRHGDKRKGKENE